MWQFFRKKTVRSTAHDRKEAGFDAENPHFREYFSALPKETRVALEALRKTIREAAPQAEETISYNIPAFKWNGMLVWYAAFKKQRLPRLRPSIRNGPLIRHRRAQFSSDQDAHSGGSSQEDSKVQTERLKENEHDRTSAFMRTSYLEAGRGIAEKIAQFIEF